jgi:hypothetical protein
LIGHGGWLGRVGVGREFRGSFHPYISSTCCPRPNMRSLLPCSAVQVYFLQAFEQGSISALTTMGPVYLAGLGKCCRLRVNDQGTGTSRKMAIKKTMKTIHDALIRTSFGKENLFYSRQSNVALSERRDCGLQPVVHAQRISNLLNVLESRLDFFWKQKKGEREASYTP